MQPASRLRAHYNTYLIVFALLLVVGIYYFFGYPTPVSSHADYAAWFWKLQMFEFRNKLNGIILMLPIMYALLVLGWKMAWLAWVVSVGVAFMPYLLRYNFTPWALTINLLFLSVPPIVGSIVQTNFERRARQKAASAERERERRNYMAQVFKAQEDERQRIAQELHDNAIQNLLIVANRLQHSGTSEASSEPGTSREPNEWATSAILHLCDDLRKLCLDLSPPILDSRGLLPALTWLVECMKQECGIHMTLCVNGELPPLPEHTEVTIFRVVQEALNNMRRHSKATEAEVALEAGAGNMRITIRDNGVGFDLPQKLVDLTRTGKLGIVGMRQRIKSLGGVFLMDSGIGEGTSIQIEINLRSDSN